MVIEVSFGANQLKMIGLEGQLCLTWSNDIHSIFFFHPRMNWLQLVCLLKLFSFESDQVGLTN